jgi:hypothetical protein
LTLKELKHAKFQFLMIGMILVLIFRLVFILSGLGNGLASLSANAFKNMEAQYVVFEEGSRHSMLRSIVPENLQYFFPSIPFLFSFSFLPLNLALLNNIVAATKALGVHVQLGYSFE